MYEVNSRNFFFAVFITTIVLRFIFAVKPDLKSQGSEMKQLTQGKNKNTLNSRKECSIEEKCRECTFEELKSMVECQATGYKVRKLCLFYEVTGTNNPGGISTSLSADPIGEDFMNEPCSENIRINAVYTFLLVCLIIAFFSFFVRKYNRNFFLQQMFEKLTILKDK